MFKNGIFPTLSPSPPLPLVCSSTAPGKIISFFFAHDPLSTRCYPVIDLFACPVPLLHQLYCYSVQDQEVVTITKLSKVLPLLPLLLLVVQRHMYLLGGQLVPLHSLPVLWLLSPILQLLRILCTLVPLADSVRSSSKRGTHPFVELQYTWSTPQVNMVATTQCCLAKLPFFVDYFLFVFFICFHSGPPIEGHSQLARKQSTACTLEAMRGTRHRQSRTIATHQGRGDEGEHGRE